jgi:DNA polymerase
MTRAVRRDLHKMHAFLRFRRVEGSEPERFVAWFEPDHFILEATAQFFIDRFRSLDWTILTPIGSLRWDRGTLTFGPPARREDALAEDGFEDGWRGYYESVFNPARVNPAAMRAEMPKKYWRNMPETASIAGLIQTASQRVDRMIEQEATMPAKRTPERALEAMWDQEPKTLKDLNDVIAKAGPLVPGATQAVFGEGPAHAEIVFVGEQPGDQEDLQGRPFVGPAGKLFTKAMGEVGIDRDKVYLTNAVKHFKFEKRGHRRIHSKPTAGEVKHYRPWLMKELELVRPKLVVALGGTALLALSGKATPITRSRGQAKFGDYRGYVTVHPSYLLRLPDEETKRAAYEAFLSDLARIRDLAQADPETGELPLAAE